MHNSYDIGANSATILRGKPLLLDTNFIIDSIIFRKEAVELLVKLRELDCELLTTRAVLIEVLGGTTDKASLAAKIAHLELLFSKPFDKIVSFPIERDLPQTENLLEFSRQCKKFGTTDFELFLTLKKYAHAHLTLVTRNHLDFTAKLFDRTGFITLLGSKEIKTFGLYTAK